MLFQSIDRSSRDHWYYLVLLVDCGRLEISQLRSTLGKPRGESSQCRPNCLALSYEACSILTATPAPASCFLTTSFVFLLISRELIFPSEMTSRFFVSGSVLMTQRGVPTRREPSMISQPRMIAIDEPVKSVESFEWARERKRTITLRKASNDVESTREDGGRSCLSLLCSDHRSVVSSELIEEMVDDIG